MPKLVVRWDYILSRRLRPPQPVTGNQDTEGFRVHPNGDTMGVRSGSIIKPQPALSTKFGTTVEKTRIAEGRVLGSPLEAQFVRGPGIFDGVEDDGYGEEAEEE